MIPCPCHEQTEDGWCEVVVGTSIHEIEHWGGRICRLCGVDVIAEEALRSSLSPRAALEPLRTPLSASSSGADAAGRPEDPKEET